MSSNTPRSHARRTALAASARFAADSRGVASIEYALLLVAVLLVGVAAYRSLGDHILISSRNIGEGMLTGEGASISVSRASSSSGKRRVSANFNNGGVSSKHPGAVDPWGGRFGARVAGTDPQAIDAILAKLAMDSYGNGDGKSIGGFTRMTDAQLRADGIDPSTLIDDKSGFRAAMYRDAQGDVVVAYAGTDPHQPADLATDVGQAAGGDMNQYDEAVTVGKNAKGRYGDKVVFTGHSLGGGLASTAASTTHSTAVTFNAAGVNDQTMQRNGLYPAEARQRAENGEIRSYSNSSDPLTNAQEKSPLPDALGRKIVVPDPHPLPPNASPADQAGHAFNSHLWPMNDPLPPPPPR